MGDEESVLARAMDRGMDHVASAIDPVIALNNIPVEIDLDEIRGRHLAKIKPKRIEQEMPLRTGNAGRDMRGEEVIISMQGRKPVKRRELDARCPFLGATLSLTEAFSEIACTAIVLFSSLVTQRRPTAHEFDSKYHSAFAANNFKFVKPAFGEYHWRTIGYDRVVTEYKLPVRLIFSYETF